MATQTRPFSINAFELGSYQNFIYLIQDHASKKAAVVDPAWEMPKVIALAQHQGYEITDVLLTHSHPDHLNGLEDILATFNAQIHLSKQEAEYWGKSLNNMVLHQDNDIIQLGHTQIKVLHTPGHTPGSICYYLDEHLITGDTLFVNGCGRCDLTGGDPRQMYHSLKKIATQLPSTTVVHPGHHYAPQPSSTLEEQIATNPFMKFKNVEDFIRYRMAGKKILNA